MNEREKAARNIHRRGTGCSQSVYQTFTDVNRNRSSAPAPRSEAGKCGAVLAAEKTLRELGLDRVREFDERFQQEFGTLKCQELLKGRYSCNDCVGRAAGIAEALIHGGDYHGY